MKILITAAIFSIYVGISCFGLYWMKIAQGILTGVFFAGAIFYGIGALLWIQILRSYPLSYAFPVCAGALVIGTTAIGYIFQGEQISNLNIYGILLIILGIVLVSQ